MLFCFSQDEGDSGGGVANKKELDPSGKVKFTLTPLMMSRIFELYPVQ